MSYKKQFITIVSWFVSSAPWLMASRVFAANGVVGPSCSSNFLTISDLFNWGTCIINKSIVPLLITAAMIVFIYGVITYIQSGADSTKRAEGANFMLWGIVGLFVITAVWGLVKILTDTFGIQNVIPQLQTR